MSFQDEDLLRRERELKEISAKLETTSQQLDDLQRRGISANEELKKLREKEVKWEAEKRRLQELLNEAETQNARLEVYRKGLDGDQQRLHLALSEKDSEIKVIRSCKFSKNVIKMAFSVFEVEMRDIDSWRHSSRGQMFQSQHDCRLSERTTGEVGT